MIKEVVSWLNGLPEDLKIEKINELRRELKKISPFNHEPVDCVQWVKQDLVKANDYNPNSVAPPEMELLHTSIKEDGYTQPIVVYAHDGIYEVVDGFHRNRVGKECEDIRERVKGYLPVVVINEDVSDLVLPFTLAKREPKPNEVLRSYGFFEGDFHVVPNRKVLQSTPGRIVTSFEFGNHERAGACGGPLINEQNELVGIHCGSSRSKQESYAVPISFLKDLLEAAHHNGIKERDLVLNGRTIGKINIDEYIYSVSVKKLGITLRTVTPWREESRVDYNHLENLIELPHSGVLEIAIVKGGTIQTGQTKATSQKLISVNLRTGSSFLEYM